ncbi:hypothetical protein [Pseudoalteromonas espejiana]|uniref:Uncharacterized protein n=1 Tax=Pseudoalteromonas espejiana TaxID=28107 RepID=A0A510XUD5_9GAMM|nr:hypothetical protein [Pseudoalteromonas espejiana]GEK54221.1 hypothetical protein PES01_10660 [Pseudoalteromonas espejiana]
MTQLSKYQHTAKRILELEPFEVDMVCFSNISNHTSLENLRQRANECGTTFCIAGRLAHIDGFPQEFWCEDHFDFTGYSTELCGKGLMSEEWDFLFSMNWPDSLIEAKKRAAYVLKHDASPCTSEWEDKWGYGKK